MAKREAELQAYDISELLKTVEKPATVYDATQVCNRAMIVNKVDYQVFEPSERNNFKGGERMQLSVEFIGNGEIATVETGQRGVTEVVAKVLDAGLIPFRCMIVKKGKFLAIAPA